MVDYRFGPDSRRAQLIDLGMRVLLADSLEHIAEQLTGQIHVDTDALHDIIRSLRQAGKYPPSTYALYADLVDGLLVGEFLEATRLLEQLIKEQPLDQTPQIVGLDSISLADQARRLVRRMDSDPDTAFPIIAPAKSVSSEFTARLHDVFGLMRQAAPELLGEIKALISQIILVIPETQSGHSFDGGSNYMMWGGLFLNAQSHGDQIALFEVLAHESAHMLLFGFSRDEALVSNADEELYPSPLREDLRPMDGIYHATWVSARMHWAMSQLIDSGMLTPTQLDNAAARMKADWMNFENGYQVIEKHGQLTDTGQAVMQSAREYMDSLGLRIDHELCGTS